MELLADVIGKDGASIGMARKALPTKGTTHVLLRLLEQGPEVSLLLLMTLRETLRILGSTSSSDLMALEVIWQPDGSGDVLSADELVMAYPNLQHL